MKIEETILALESTQADPVALIESLIAEEPQAAQALLSRLETSQLNRKVPNRFERLFQGFSAKLRAERLAVQRILIALGAIRTQKAIPALLDWLANTSFDRKLGMAAGWSLANIGEEAVMPLFLFARCRELLESARSLAIITLGYIADPRIPSILRQLWQDYRLEVPDLVIATLIGLGMRQGVEEARKLALETEHLWHFHGVVDDHLDNYWINLKLETSIDRLKSAIEHLHPEGSLPPWPKVLRELEAS